MTAITYLEAIRQGLWEEMERDPRVFLLGQDVGIYGGAFRVTAGMLDRFGPERVIDTPISESAMVGTAIGAAMMGLFPVVEMQFIDFISCAFNQIVNFAGPNHYRWGQPVPLVIRGPAGGNVHGSAFHSQNPESYFQHTPVGTPYHMLILLKEIRGKIGKEFGDTVTVTVEADTKARVVKVPADLKAELKKNKKILDLFNQLSYTHQKEYVRWIEEAKRSQTRQDRVLKTIELLKGGKKGI